MSQLQLKLSIFIIFSSDLLHVGNNESRSLIFMDSINGADLEILHERTVQDTQSLLDRDENTLKYKISYIVGQLVHK